MKTSQLLNLTVALSTLFLAACHAGSTTVVSTSDRAANNVVSHGIDITDFKRSASKLVDDINEKGVLNRYQGRQAVIGVGNIDKRIADRIDPTMLIDVILSSLGDKARLMINRGLGADGLPRYEDYMGAAKAQEDRFIKDAQQAPRPDLTLTGEIKSSYSRDKKAKLYTYTIYLKLTDGETVVWQGYEEISKLVK